jgi:hypothetical protein
LDPQILGYEPRSPQNQQQFRIQRSNSGNGLGPRIPEKGREFVQGGCRKRIDTKYAVYSQRDATLAQFHGYEAPWERSFTA